MVLPMARSSQRSKDRFEPNTTTNNQTTKTCDDPVCGPIWTTTVSVPVSVLAPVQFQLQFQL